MVYRRRLALLAAVILAATGCSSSNDPGTPASQAELNVRTGRTPNASFQVTAPDFGIHSFSTKPQIPAGSIRPSCSPNWRAINPAEGEFQWADMDRRIAQDEAWGFNDILFSFCGTPEWAGTPAPADDVAVFGPGSAQPPKDLRYWTDAVRQVAERYRGRILGYEIWNEPSSTQFFTGTPEQMAEMTELAYRTIKEVDPAAYVFSGGVQTHNERYDTFSLPYLEALGKRGWPVDGISAHFYPDGKGTPADRVRQIERLQADLQKLSAPEDLPLWDTEVNYAVGLPGGPPNGRITGDRAVAWTAQTFLDSWRTGVRRTYWYLWTPEYYEFPGIQMRPNDPSTKAYNTLATWTVGSTFQGCTANAAAVSCAFTGQDSQEFRIAWALKKTAVLNLAGLHQVCPVTGDACRNESGSIELTEIPVRIA